MKIKERVTILEEDVETLQGCVRLLQRKEQSDPSKEQSPEEQLIEDRSLVDWKSTASVVKHFTISDLTKLITIAKPYYAGPLWYSTLRSIVVVSGLCYGFSKPKQSFLRFTTDNMEIDEPLAEVLYLCKKTAGYGIFPRNVIIQAQNDQAGKVFQVNNERVIIEVMLLAKEFLRVLKSIDTRAMKCKLPRTENYNEIQSQALQHLQDKESKCQ